MEGGGGRPVEMLDPVRRALAEGRETAMRGAIDVYVHRIGCAVIRLAGVYQGYL